MTRHSWLRVAVPALLVGVIGLTLLSPRALRAQDGSTFFLALATGSQEVPSVDSPGIAFGRFILSPDKKQLAYTIHIFGLKGQFRAMHLHRGKPGEAGPVAYPLAPPTDGKSTGTVAFGEADLALLNAQGLYLNIHSDQHTGGEIRGQVVPSPDPAIGEEVPAGVSFAKEIQPIFTASCSCHIGPRPEQGMNLGPGQAFANIVGVKSVQARNVNRIEAGDPAKSYLIHKLNNTQRSVGGTGSRMPLGGRLAQDRVDLITKWVQQGAKNN